MKGPWQHSALAVALAVSCQSMGIAAESPTSESVAATPPSLTAASEGYALMGWLNTRGIVEQLQMIHRLGQNHAPEALRGLIAALDSPFPLARRKASRTLLERARNSEGDEQRMLAILLTNALNHRDPVVQGNIIRLMADLNNAESAANLQRFFRHADADTQLRALESLSQVSQVPGRVMAMVQQFSPFAEVRAAVQEP